jgi:hypothetical protein
VVIFFVDWKGICPSLLDNVIKLPFRSCTRNRKYRVSKYCAKFPWPKKKRQMDANLHRAWEHQKCLRQGQIREHDRALRVSVRSWSSESGESPPFGSQITCFCRSNIDTRNAAIDLRFSSEDAILPGRMFYRWSGDAQKRYWD